jgi:hypothetical protein
VLALLRVRDGQDASDRLAGTIAIGQGLKECRGSFDGEIIELVSHQPHANKDLECLHLHTGEFR